MEVRIAFQEKLIADLDDVVRAVRDEVDALRARLDLLEAQAQAELAPVTDEPPPHY